MSVGVESILNLHKSIMEVRVCQVNDVYRVSVYGAIGMDECIYGRLIYESKENSLQRALNKAYAEIKGKKLFNRIR